MRPFLALLPALALMAGCGPWIITPPTSAPAATATASTWADAVEVLAERFDLDERAFVTTADGLVFVADRGDELQLLLSRAGNTEQIEILATVQRPDTPDDSSGFSSFVVACPEGATNVRYYLFGEDTGDLARTMTGLDAVGGEVVDGRWLMAIVNDEIAPDQRWEIRDALGTTLLQSGTGALFLSDEEVEGGQSTLCRSVH